MASNRSAIGSTQVAELMVACSRASKAAHEVGRVRIAKTLNDRAHQLDMIAPLYRQTAMSGIVVGEAKASLRRWARATLSSTSPANQRRSTVEKSSSKAKKESKPKGPKVDLEEIKLNKGGYENNGRGKYWGVGPRLWRYYVEIDNRMISKEIRAVDKNNAKELIRGFYPGATF